MTIDINRLKSGDESAFRECVESHKDIVFNTIFQFTRNRDDVEDIAQEVFIEVHRALKRFRGEAKLSTWIYRIAVNKSLDFLRLHKRQKRKGTLLSIGSGKEGEPEIDVPDYRTPADALIEKERASLLHQAVLSLPKNQQAAITLSKYQGLSNSEIADILQLSLSAVESLIHRAKHNIYKKLARYFKNHL